jgi:hypothetical protein
VEKPGWTGTGRYNSKKYHLVSGKHRISQYVSNRNIVGLEGLIEIREKIHLEMDCNRKCEHKQRLL